MLYCPYAFARQIFIFDGKFFTLALFMRNTVHKLHIINCQISKNMKEILMELTLVNINRKQNLAIILEKWF